MKEITKRQLAALACALVSYVAFLVGTSTRPKLEDYEYEKAWIIAAVKHSDNLGLIVTALAIPSVLILLDSGFRFGWKRALGRPLGIMALVALLPGIFVMIVTVLSFVIDI